VAPVNFFSSYEDKHISRAYSPGYDLNTARNGISVSVNNDFFPAQLSYQRTVSETSGLGEDQTFETSNLTISGRHFYRYSDTDLLVSFSESDAEGESAGSRNFAESSLFSGNNRITSSDRKKTLTSSLRYLEAVRERGDSHSNITVSEGFAWHLGKALSLRLNYSWAANEAETERGGSTESVSHAGGARLTHRLFQSLDSSFSAQGRKIDYDNGDETTWSGTVEFDYRKVLSPDSAMDLHYIESYIVTDRDVGSQVQDVWSEEMTIAETGDNLLANPDVIIASIVVRDAENPAIRYFSEDEGLAPDYRIIRLGAFVGIDVNIPASRLVDGTRVVVTYSYTTEPHARYTTSLRSLSGGVGIKGGYRVFGSFSQTEQSYSEGEAKDGSEDSRSYSLGVSRTVGQMFASLVYANQDAPQFSRQYLEGVFRSQHYIRETILQFQVRDRYTTFDQESGEGGRQNENRFSLSANGSRRLFRNGRMMLSVQYLNVRGDTANLDGLNIEGDYRWQRGRLALAANASTGYRDYDGDRNVWESRLYLNLSRAF
jgi:hypothetical protein